MDEYGLWICPPTLLKITVCDTFLNNCFGVLQLMNMCRARGNTTIVLLVIKLLG